MTLRKQIRDRFNPGQIFSIDDLTVPNDKKASVCTQLSKMVSKNDLSKLARGAYYIPQKSKLFGTLPPSENQIIAYVCKKTDGYPSGLSLYNKLGLTEQVPNVTEIATRKNPSKKEFKNTRIVFIKAYLSPEGKDIYLLQLLDFITDIKHIPSRTIMDSFTKIKETIQKLTSNQKSDIVSYSHEYPPRTRYTLYRIFESLGEQSKATTIKQTLNSTTRFTYKY